MNAPRPRGLARIPAPEALRAIVQLPLLLKLYMLAVITPGLFYLAGLLMSPLRLLILIVFIPLSIRLFTGKYGRVCATDVLFFLFGIWAIIALWRTTPGQMVSFAGANMLEFMGGYLIARASIRNSEDFTALCRAAGLVVCLTLILALPEMLTGRPLLVELFHRIPGMTSVNVVDYPRRMGLERVQAVMPHPILYGVYCSTAFSLVVVGLRGRMTPLWHGLMIAGVVVATLTSLSSGAILPLVLQLILILWAWVFRGSRHPWLLLIVIAVLLYAIAAVLVESPYRLLMSMVTFSPWNAYIRELIFQSGILVIRDNPLFGIGLEPDWPRHPLLWDPTVDNFWLLTGMRYGLPGFAFLAGGYLWSMLRIGLRDLGDDPHLIAQRRAWMFTFVGLTLSLCTVHIWNAAYSYVFFLFGSGMWLLSAGPAAGLRNATGPLRRADEPAPYRRNFAAPEGGLRRSFPPSHEPAAPPAPVQSTDIAAQNTAAGPLTAGPSVPDRSRRIQ